MTDKTPKKDADEKKAPTLAELEKRIAKLEALARANGWSGA